MRQRPLPFGSLRAALLLAAGLVPAAQQETPVPPAASISLTSCRGR
jgi:hypothetical protein